MRRCVLSEPAIVILTVTFVFHHMADLALAYKQVNRHDNAIHLLKTAVEKHPDVAKLWNNLGSIILDSSNHKPQDSVEHLRKAVAIEAQNPEFRHNLAIALRDAESYDDAEPEFHRAATLMKQSMASSEQLAEVYHDWALCLQRNRQLESAVEKWKIAIEANPGHKEARVFYIAASIAIQDDFTANSCTLKTSLPTDISVAHIALICFMRSDAASANRSDQGRKGFISGAPFLFTPRNWQGSRGREVFAASYRRRSVGD